MALLLDDADLQQLHLVPRPRRPKPVPKRPIGEPVGVERVPALTLGDVVRMGLGADEEEAERYTPEWREWLARRAHLAA